jgi:dynein light chain Tctex-type 1
MSQKKWTFDVTIIKGLIKSTLDDVLKEQEYDQKQVQAWANTSVEKILQQMQQKAERYKFVVTCTIMQRKGAGLHSTSSCLWDKTSDNCCSDKWENKTMYCIVSVFALKC